MKLMIANILAFLFTAQVAVADTKITQLPLGNAATSSTQSVTVYVDLTDNTTKKMRLSDFVNIPALAAPSFCTGKQITGFVAGAGTVSASDTVLQAINKIVGNINAIAAASVSVGPFGSSPNNNGGTISSNVLTLQPADATHPGGVSTTTQSFGGNKTFTGTIAASNFSGSSSGTNTGDQTITLTSDVTGSGTGSFATTIAAGAVSNSKMANMAASTIKGRAAGAGTGAPQDLTSAQATAILDDFVGDSGTGGVKGLVPAPGAGDATKALLGNGTWGSVGTSSPLTTKGDLYTYSTTNARLPVGSNNYLLVPNSGQTTGLEWVSTLPTAAVPAFTGGDITSAGGSLALTVATVGGETAADVATSVQDTQAATDIGTPNTLMKRDGTGEVSASKFIGDLEGTADTALAFATTPAQCTGGQVAEGIDANGDANCITVDSSPLTTKGDLYTYSTLNTRLPVGTNGQLLVPNSAQTTGLEWITTLPTAALPAFTGGDVTSSAGSLSLNIGNNTVTDAKLRQSAGLSVIGRAASSTGNVADITAGADYNILRRSGTSIGFGSIDLSQSGAVGSSVLPIANGGTNGATKTAGFNNLSPSTTKGDLIGHDGTNNIRLAACTDDEMRVYDSTKSSGFRCQTANLSLTTDPVAYTPTFTGLGSVSIASPDDCTWARNGQFLLLDCKFTMGTGTATEARMSLPSGLTVDTPNIKQFGQIFTSVNEQAVSAPLGNTGQNYITFGYANGGAAAPLTSRNGNSLWATGATASVQARIPIAEWAQSTTVNIFEAGDFGWTRDDSLIVPNNFGTVSGKVIWKKRVGDTLFVKGFFNSGTPGAATAYLALSGLSLDNAKISMTNGYHAGVGNQLTSPAAALYTSATPYVLFADGTNADRIFVSYRSSSNAFQTDNASGLINAGNGLSFEFSVPISGWSTFPIGVAGGNVQIGDGSKKYRTEFFNMAACSTSNCTLSNMSTPGWATATRFGTGGYNVAFTSGIFSNSVPPNCSISGVYNSGYTMVNFHAFPTTSGFGIDTRNETTGSGADMPITVSCTGERP